MQSLWQKLVEGHSDFFCFALLPTLTVTLAYFVGAIPCWLLDRSSRFRKYKIQPLMQDTRTWLQCVWHVVRYKFVAEIPLTFASFPLFVWLGVQKDLPLPAAGTILGTLVVSCVIEDAWHYFAHRSLHTRWAFKKIHYQHHAYTTPIAVAANYAHPIETIYTGFGTILPVLLIRPHLYTMLIWIALRQWQALAVHVGYDFPWAPSRFLPFIGGAKFHDRHHRRFNRNYAPMFVWLDRLLGTADEKALGPHGLAAPTPIIAEE
jgi:sterol desaturase/sphingolipid hydroxylase (fatty acid hydroxylase superfamily)